MAENWAAAMRAELNRQAARDRAMVDMANLVLELVELARSPHTCMIPVDEEAYWRLKEFVDDDGT